MIPTPHPNPLPACGERVRDSAGEGRPVRCLNMALVACLACATGAAYACGEQLHGDRQTAENGHYVVAYTTTPQPIVVGRHFVVDFVVCPRAGTTAPQSVRVDANMPAHRHGMNYRAAVSGAGAGAYRAEGLLFHMPGRWDLTFDLVSGSTTERLASALQVE